MDFITTKDLTVRYGDKSIIENMNAHIPKGEVTVIIGANGCGKSTLLKSIARILKPHRGDIFIDGANIKSVSSNEIARKMAVLPQSPKAPLGLKVKELVAYGRFPHKKGFGALNKEDFEMIEHALATAGMLEYKERNLEDLSGGQRQRAWIAMSLCQNTEAMLLDEPTTYLDLAHQLDVLSLLSKLNKEQGRTIVMVLHELNNAARFADCMIGMKQGQIVAQGTPEQVMTKENMRIIYGIDAHIIIDPRTGKPIYTSYCVTE